MNQWFHVNFYKENLRRLRGAGLVAFVIFMLEAVLVPMGFFISEGLGKGISSLNFIEIGFCLNVMPFLAYSFMRSLFKDLNSRNGSDFYFALPVTRKAMITTAIAAVMTWVTALFVIPTIVEVLLMRILGYPVDLTTVFHMFWYSIIVSFYISGASILAKSFSGTEFSETVVGGMILLYPRLFIIFVTEIILSLVPYLSLMNSGNILFDYNYNLFVYYVSHGEICFASSVYTLLLGLVYFLLAFVFFQKRPGETATYPASSERVQGTIRTLIPMMFCLFPIGLMLTTKHIEAEDLFSIFVLYVIAVVIYFVYDILAHKKVSSVKRAAKKIWWLAAMNIVTIIFIVSVTSFSKGRRVEAEDIDYVVIKEFKEIDRYNTSSSNTYLKGCILGEKLVSQTLFEALSKELDSAIEQGEYYHYQSRYDEIDPYRYEDSHLFTIQIHKKNGLSLTRKLYIHISDLNDVAITDTMISKLNKEFKTNRYNDTSIQYLGYQVKDGQIYEIGSGYMGLKEQLFSLWNQMTVQQKWEALTNNRVKFVTGKVNYYYVIKDYDTGLMLYLPEDQVPNTILLRIKQEMNYMKNDYYE